MKANISGGLIKSFQILFCATYIDKVIKKVAVSR